MTVRVGVVEYRLGHAGGVGEELDLKDRAGQDPVGRRVGERGESGEGGEGGEGGVVRNDRPARVGVGRVGGVAWRPGGEDRVRIPVLHKPGDLLIIARFVPGRAPDDQPILEPVQRLVLKDLVGLGEAIELQAEAGVPDRDQVLGNLHSDRQAI